MTRLLGMVAAILPFVGVPAFGEDSLLMTCAQHGTGAMTLRFVRETGAARNIEVIGQANVRQWTVRINGQDATPPTQTLNSPGIVAVHVADTITFKVTNPRHGILFLSEELARGFLEFDEAAGKPLGDRPPKGEFDWGTDKFDGPNDILAVAKVRDGSTDSPPTAEEKFLAKLTPSMQRRMLRFVNRAYTPEDLMKSPQELRMKSEHLPPKGHRSASDAKAGFQPNVAKSLIDRRPLGGYRDMRECLPSYQQSGGLDSLRGVLDSIGPKQFGRWEEVTGQVPAVMHGALLHTGKMLLLTDTTDSVLWDPAAATFTVLPGATSGLTDNLFCSGHSFLSDGRLLVVGGGGSGPVNSTSAHGWIFDPVTSKWRRTGDDMAFQRWYPSLVTLGRESEQVLVAAGLTPFGPSARMEIYSEASDRFELVTATGPTGDLLFPGTYPSLRALPGGEILHVATGWGVSGAPCDQSADGAAVEPTAIFTFSGPSTGSWRTLGPNNRLKGMAVTLFEFPFLQSLVVGGGGASQSATAATMNLSTASPAWDPAFPLLEARVHPNIVVLPDGTVFICGGKESSAPTPPDGGRCELFDPRPGAVALTEMDEMNRFRHYHSLAMLLPDGRVMAAGGAARGGCTVSEQNTIEVFNPPYLFRGPRPVISSAAKFVEHGGTIEIKTPAAANIRRVVLARPAAVTHQTDSEQRVLPLSFQVTGPDTIEAIAPGGPGANPIAPRGHYMLFILSEQGVPSVSTWIFIR